MRDALSLLDQIVAFSGDEKVTHKMVLDIIGTVDNKMFADIIKNINEKNISNCIEQINEIYLNGKDMKQFVSQMVEFLRNLLIVSSIHDSEDILDMSTESVEELKQLTQIVSYDKILEYINEFAALESKIKYDSQPKITVEITLIRLASLEVRVRMSEVPNEKKVEQVKKQSVKKIIDKALPEDIKQGIKMWKDIKEACANPLKSMLVDTEAKYYNNKSYCIVCSDNIIKSYMEKNINVIQNKIEDILKKEYNIKLMTKEEYENEMRNSNESSENEEPNKDDEDMKNVEEFFNKFGVKVERIEN